MSWIPSRMRRVAMVGFFGMLLLVSWRTWARPLGLLEPSRPQPDVLNLRYGPFDRNFMDVWKAKSKIGGRDSLGGFLSWRWVPEWRQVDHPALAHFQVLGGWGLGRLGELSAVADSTVSGSDARWSTTIQFIRSQAKELGIDPNRIAASGSSAGAGIALWVGFHDELADPQSLDAIARQSSRVTCLGVDGAQTSYDPRFIKSVIGGRAHEHSALRSFYGITSDADLNTPQSHRAFRGRIADYVCLVRRSAGYPVLQGAKCPTPCRRQARRGNSSPPLWRGPQGQAGPAQAWNASSATARTFPSKKIPTR